MFNARMCYNSLLKISRPADDNICNTVCYVPRNAHTRDNVLLEMPRLADDNTCYITQQRPLAESAIVDGVMSDACNNVRHMYIVYCAYVYSHHTH